MKVLYVFICLIYLVQRQQAKYIRSDKSVNVVSVSCFEYSNCSSCIQYNCTWCLASNLCDLNCVNSTSTNISCPMKSHSISWLIVIPVGLYLIGTILLFVQIKSFYGKREKALRTHARRTDTKDFSALGDTSEIDKCLEGILAKEEIIWSDASLVSGESRIWGVFVFSVVIIIAGGIPVIYFCFVKNYADVWPVFVAVTFWPTILIALILFVARNKMLSELNVLTPTGAYIFYFSNNKTYTFFAHYQDILNAELIEESDGSGTITFRIELNYQRQFFNIIDAREVMKILEEKMALHPKPIVVPKPTAATLLLQECEKWKKIRQNS